MNFKKEINKHNGDNFFPKYSICICNYNMADTIEKALTSVLDQIDERFEVLLVDDGSNDKSVEIIRKIQKKYSSLRLITLQRSSKRQLGKTRNLSVKEAKGEYVILHVDADDYWEPYIITFINLFHRLESLIKKDILVAGNQINIGKRNFLLKYGPYRNTHRAQDRDMWHRLASIERYIPIDHLPFRQRLSRPNSIRIYRVFRNTWFQILYDLRNDKKRYCYVFACLLSIFKRNKNVTLRLKIVRRYFRIKWI